MVIGSNQIPIIDRYMFDKNGRLNFRRFDKFLDEFPDAYSEIHEYTSGMRMPDETFRTKFLIWRNQYTQENLICRRIGCDNLVPWTNKLPHKLCSNKCRKLDGAQIGINLKKSNLLKYGVTSTAKLDTTKDKFRETILKNNHIKNKDKYYDITFIKKTFFDKDNHFMYKEFMDFFGVIQPTAHGHLIRLGIEYTRTLSAGESDVGSFIDTLGVKFVKNSRKIIPPKELDIFIPEFNLAIEYNGLYWHSYGEEHLQKDLPITHTKYRHLDKTEDCAKKGIDLIHILQSEWECPVQRNIWKNIIRYKLGLITDRIGARKTTLVELLSSDRKKVNSFINKFHLQGRGPNWSTAFGLFLGDELVSLMTFGPSRTNKEDSEILRLATIPGLVICGGASRLLAAFVKKYKPKTIVTFADRRFSQGQVYTKLGFTRLRTTRPNFKVFKKGTFNLEPREKFQKHKLIKILPTFDPDKTAVVNLINNNYRIIWDSGNILFKKDIHDNRK